MRESSAPAARRHARAEEGTIAGANTTVALERLHRALRRLEATVAVQREAAMDVDALADDRARLERDRAVLAARLDAAEARAARLAAANDEVARRLVTIMERVRQFERPPEGGR